MKQFQLLFSLSLFFNIILIVCTGILVYYFHSDIYKKITANKKFTVVMFGNSLTSHCNWSHELKRNDVLNSGLPGFTTYNFIQSLNKHVFTHKPGICFVEAGINDLMLDIPLINIKENYRKIIDLLIQKNIEPVLQSVIYVNFPDEVTTRKTNSNADSLNLFLQELAVEKNITYIDLNNYLSENGKLKVDYQVDGLHLNKEAYRIWAARVTEVLKTKGY